MTRPSHPTRGALVAPNYLLTCQHDSMGPCAVLEDPEAGTSYTIDAFNRAAFLYAVLERMGDSSEGWVPCESVARSVWGRKATANNVNTLVYRIRRELKAAGFSPQFLEVKRGHVRLIAPNSEMEPEHSSEVDQLNTALSELRDATPEQRDEAHARLHLAIERVGLVPDLFLDARS